MPTFKFKAQDRQGKLVTNTLVANTEQEAENLLKDQELRPLVLSAQKESRTLFGSGRSFPLAEKISLCRYLSVMINAGMAIGEAFDLIIRYSLNPTIKKVLQDISSSVRQGQTLFAGFSRYPQYFDETFFAMIKVGEISGSLTNSFAYLAKQYQQENSLKKKVVGALIYPLVIVGLMFAVGFLMITFVLPRLGQVFLKLNLDLPLPTRLLLQLSLFMEKNLLLAIGVLVIFSFGLLAIFKNPRNQQWLTRGLTRLPLVKTLFQQYNLARFTQSLSSLLAAGVPIGESLEIAAKALSGQQNQHLSASFAHKIAQGLPLSTVFLEAKIFPPLLTQMVSIGEKAGNLEKILSDLSAFYQEEVENSLKNFIALLEPLLMVVVGVGVGLMIIAFISPIYGLIGKLQPK
ncbi:MAG: type II secretion system F family protein [Candidatus Shapirobacteria bacterium]